MMRDHIKNAVILLAAVVGGWAAGHFGVSEFVMGGARPQRVLLPADACAQGNADRVQGKSVQTHSRYIRDVKAGPYRSRAVRVVGVDSDGRCVTESVAAGDARQGLCKTFRVAALRKCGKAPLEERYARTRRGGVFGRNGKDDENGPIIYPDDIYIDGIPMVDQGKKAYCAAAAAARVLQGYGVEITMEDMVALAGTSDTKGTDVNDWEKALRQVAKDHGLRLKTVSELTH